MELFRIWERISWTNEVSLPEASTWAFRTPWSTPLPKASGELPETTSIGQAHNRRGQGQANDPIIIEPDISNLSRLINIWHKEAEDAGHVRDNSCIKAIPGRTHTFSGRSKIQIVNHLQGFVHRGEGAVRYKCGRCEDLSSMCLVSLCAVQQSHGAAQGRQYHPYRRN